MMNKEKSSNLSNSQTQHATKSSTSWMSKLSKERNQTCENWLQISWLKNSNVFCYIELKRPMYNNLSSKEE